MTKLSIFAVLLLSLSAASALQCSCPDNRVEDMRTCCISGNGVGGTLQLVNGQPAYCSVADAKAKDFQNCCGVGKDHGVCQ
ncbi:hypothetical protein BX666DRAFT_1977020 [Dichotomocladium elegans]|nr:hypothetical protein BX666DRAFT_1977020 [Dichotomocladium elegans]